MMETGHVLLSATTAAALLGLISLAALLTMGMLRKRSPYWYPMIFWLAHATIFFWVNLWVRLTDGYTFPSVLFSSWSVVIYLQAFVSMLALTMIKFRMDRPR